MQFLYFWRQGHNKNMSSKSQFNRRFVRFRRPLSRRVRRLMWLVAVLALLAAFSAQRVGLLPAPVGTDRTRFHEKVFTVIKVVDGDTLDLDVPDGDRAYTRVRLWGVDTPETKHPRRGLMYFGPEAAQFARQLVLGRQVTVFLEPFENTRGKYGRLLAYIYLPDGRMLNEELIAQGFGYADERFRHMFRAEFLALQKQARREKLGLWKDSQPYQWPEWFRRRHDPDFEDIPAK